MRGVFEAFKDHCRNPRISTSTFVLCLLRDKHLSYYVVEAEEINVSLLEFAKAGNANIEYSRDDSMSTRKWCPDDKLLEDEDCFAKFKYIWQGITYTVYYVVWKDAYMPMNRMFYILQETNESIDALMSAAGEWTSKVHGELFVF